MADITQVMRFTIDIKNGLTEQPQRAVLMEGDDTANRVVVALQDGSQAVSLDGATVTGTFTRKGDVSVDIELVGEAEGNEASVTLDEHCYAESCRYELRIRVTLDGVKRTILFISGRVESKGSGGILNVENVIPSVDDIVAQYATMKQVTAQTEAARDDALLAAQTAKFKVLDRYETYDLLTAAHPTGEAGEAYAVGTAEDNVVYIWGVDVLTWVNIGNIQGPQGVQGNAGVSPTITVESITGGHRITITDATGAQAFVVPNGSDAQAIVYTINSKSADDSGNFTLSASDVGALPSTYEAPVSSVNGQTGAVTVDVGVTSVNGQTGAVTVPNIGMLQYAAEWDETQNAFVVPISAYTNPASTTDAAPLTFMVQVSGKTAFVGNSFISEENLYIRAYNSSWESWGSGETLNILYLTA